MNNKLQTTAAALQSHLDALPDGETLQLCRGEYAGPIIINKPLTLDGQGSTIWAGKGPVITVTADKVRLKDFKVHATGSAVLLAHEDRCALAITPGLSLLLERVEVIGSVAGLREEEGPWRYPLALNLGQVAHGKAHSFLLRLAVPIPCGLTSNISGLALEPHSLAAGKHEVRLHLDHLANDTLLSGTLAITTAFLKRHILFTAHVIAQPATAQPPAAATTPVIWEPSDWATLTIGPQPEPPKPQAAQTVSVPAPATPAPSTTAPPAAAPATNPASPLPVPSAPQPVTTPSRRKTQHTPGGVFAQSSTTAPDGNEAAKPADRSAKTAPVNPIFEKEAVEKPKETPPPAETNEAPPQTKKQAEQAKRKMVKPGTISPLFHVNGERDEKKGGGAGGN